MVSTPSLLLRGGTALLHGDNDRVEAIVTDILIVGSKTARIELGIVAPDAEVVDCSDSIISPGFIDTHHHVWQSQFRGVHADQSLVQFAASGTSGNFAGKLFAPKDVFWGQLAGCMEMIDVGTTTVVDYTYVSPMEEYGSAGIAATVASGVRSVFCHYAMATVSDWGKMLVNFDLLKDHVDTLQSLVRNGPYGDGRVTIGFAFDGWAHAPEQHVAMLLRELDALNIPLLTCHYWWRDGDMARPTGLETLWLQKGKVVRDVGHSTEEAFNLATILGARAIKREKDLGSIAVGKFADLVLFKKRSPSMVCAAEQNPVAAIILNSSPADVDTVIVGGVVRKHRNV